MQKPADSCVGIGTGVGIYTIMSGLVDFKAERERLERELGSIDKDVAKFEKKLSNPGFLAKAAKEIIEKDTAKLAALKEKQTKLKEQIEELS